jgi:hypothetical protein
MPQGHEEVSAIEARGAHADQHLVRLRDRLRYLADLDSIGAQDRGFHATLTPMSEINPAAQIAGNRSDVARKSVRNTKLRRAQRHLPLAPKYA